MVHGTNSQTSYETYNKVINLSHSFGDLGGNIYVPFLLLTRSSTTANLCFLYSKR